MVIPSIKYLRLFYVYLFGYYRWYELLGIIDGDDCSDYESDFWFKLRIIVASCFVDCCKLQIPLLGCCQVIMHDVRKLRA